jgi:iron complex outermembrane receptor protein
VKKTATRPRQPTIFVRSALAAAVAASFSGGAYGQATTTPAAPAAEGDTQELEAIEVTGSRIPRPQLESASPVTVIEREEILATGITDVGDLLQRLPSMSGSPIGTTTNNGGNGSVLVDLRGMGTNRTLTLINGKRIVDGGDYQTIPASMIERVEILKDGGSAVYGADAVAGVVNIITRKDFSGLSFDAQTNRWFDVTGGAQTAYNMVAGHSFDGGNFVFGAEYVDQQHAFQSDTPWDFFQNSYYIYPEGCENQVAAPYDGTPSGGCYPVGSSRIPEGRAVSGQHIQRFYSDATPRLFDWFNGELNRIGGVSGGAPNPAFDPAYGVPTFRNPVFMEVGDADGPETYDNRTYNFSPVNYIQTPYERTNLFANGSFDLTSNLRFVTEFRGNFRKSSQELAPQPYNSPTDPGYNGRFNPVDPITGQPLREELGTNADGNDVFHYTSDQAAGQVVTINYSGVSEDSFYNPLGFPITDARRRILEVPRRFTQDITQYQTVAGFEGTFMDMNWDVSYNKGFRSRIDRDFGQWSGPRLEVALGPSADLLDATGQPGTDGLPECYEDINDPTTLIAGCVPANLLGGPNTMTADQLAFLNVDLNDSFETTLDEVGANLNGTALKLPGGPLGWAVGYGYKGETFEFSPDSAKQLDLVTGNTGVGTKGSLYGTAFIGEVYAPVFDNGSQSVALKGGVRFDEYNLFGSETTWQLGVEFNPMEAMKLRATAGTVFRAPTIGELFAGEADSFPTYTDPCAAAVPGPGCAQQAPPPTDSQVLARVGGNPNLQPESGDTFTAGMVWEPKLPVGQFAVTLDYWNIQIDDGISSLGVQYILDDCANTGNASTCSLITRNQDYSVAQVKDLALNVAEQKASGIDTEFRYGFSPGLGRVSTSLLWTHLLERTKVAFPGDAENDLSARFTDPTAQDGGAYAEDKINYGVRWNLGGLPFGDLMVGYLGEYISGLTADTFCNCDTSAGTPAADPTGNTPYFQDIDAQLYHDLVSEVTLPMGFKVMAGITNVTDEEPPFIEVGFNASTDPSTYRMFGRGWFLRAAYEFR